MFLRSNEMHSIITLLCVRRFSQHRKPNGIALSPDGGTLAVPDYGGTQTWTFRINASGVLDAMMPTMPMRLPIDSKGEFKFNEPPPYIQNSKGDGIAVDKIGRFYVTSDLGVQVLAPTGRPCGVLPKPDKDQLLTTCILAGVDHQSDGYCLASTS